MRISGLAITTEEIYPSTTLCPSSGETANLDQLASNGTSGSAEDQARSDIGFADIFLFSSEKCTADVEERVDQR